jgi:DNA-binding response OmpR family regulator
MSESGNNVRKRVIMVVEDDPSMIRLIAEGLEPMGFEILSATDGNRGLACVEFYRPDLVILDLMMPKRSGLLVLEGMREMDQYIPAIMITGNDGSRHRHYAEILGVDAYLNKPIRIEVLVRTVQRILGDAVPGRPAVSH